MKAEVKEVEVIVDYNHIDNEIDEIYKNLDAKVQELESRVEDLREKEKILDKFIFTNHAQLENLDSTNYKLRTQLQVAISKQLETQQLVSDTIIKYEKIIQDYLFQKQRLQNDKLSNYLKWKKTTESSADDNKFLEVLKKFEDAVSVVGSSNGAKSDNLAAENEIVKSIVQQTYKEGYEL